MKCIRQQFASSDNITEEEITAYTEKMAEVKKLAKYKDLGLDIIGGNGYEL